MAKGLEAIQGEVKSEPLNRNFSYLDSLVFEAHTGVVDIRPELAKNTKDIGELQGDVGDINKKVNNFDFTSVPPSYYETLWGLPSNTVMQCFVFCEETNEIYVSQLDGAQTGVETFLLARFTFDGVYLDHMKLVNGGHGTSFGIEVAGSSVYIWSNYQNAAGTTHDLVRFKYTPGSTLNENSASLTRYNKFTSGYAIPTVDQKNDLIALRTRSSEMDKGNVVTLRKLSDIKNGVNKVLATVNIPDEIGYLQGFTIDGYDLYWYSGDVNEENHPSEITLFDMNDSTIKRRIRADFGQGIEGVYERDFKEPEGIYLYTEPKTKAKTLFVGMVTDEAVRRRNKIYGFHSLSNEAKFLGIRGQKVQGFALTYSDGTAKRIPTGITRLSDIKTPGDYYFSTIDSEGYVDFPTDIGGGYLHVLPPAPNNGTFQQILVRHSDDGNHWAFRRQITNGSIVGKWRSEPIAGTLKWRTVTLTNGATTVDPVEYSVSGTTGHLRGRAVIPSTDGITITTLPLEARPGKSTYFNAPVAGTTGIRKIMISSNGDVVAYGIMANNPESVESVYLDFTYPLRNE